ncbi:hypothetical protein X975_02275, partial [Stegodyphus mimosarum]
MRVRFRGKINWMNLFIASFGGLIASVYITYPLMVQYRDEKKKNLVTES